MRRSSLSKLPTNRNQSSATGSVPSHAIELTSMQSKQLQCVDQGEGSQRTGDDHSRWIVSCIERRERATVVGGPPELEDGQRDQPLG
jgi:hypothetical protein